MVFPARPIARFGPDVAGEAIDCLGFRRCAGKPDEEIRITFEQFLRDFDVTRQWPATQRQQIARVRIQKNQGRVTELRIFPLQQCVDFGSLVRAGAKGGEVLVGGRDKVERRQDRRITGQRFHHHFEHLTGMKMWIVDEPMRHEIAAIRSIAKKSVKADARFCPGHRK